MSLPPGHRVRLREVARRVGLRRTPRVLQSAWLEVPTVVGWARPLVLLPAGLLCGLTAFEVEAILAHEFAHIRRRDYLVNLLQSLVEVFLFYHPAVWWVSGRVRAEREKCCDDVAASACGDRLRYARVLARMEGLRAVPAQAALAAGGGVLLSRVRRLLEGRESEDGPGWRTPAGCAALALCSLGLFAAGRVDAEAQQPATVQGPTGGAVAAPPAPPVDGTTDSAREKVRAGHDGGSRPRPAASPEQPATKVGDGGASGRQEARRRGTRGQSPVLPFDRLPSLTESQKDAVEELRRAQEPPPALKALRQAFMVSLSHDQRRQLQEARGRAAAAGGMPGTSDLPFLTEEQKQSYLELRRGQADYEDSVRRARRAVFAALSPGQRRELLAMRPGGRSASASNRAAAGADNGTRGVVERLDGRVVIVRPHSPGIEPELLRLEAGEMTVVARDGRASRLSELEAGDRVRVASSSGVATRIDARSAARAGATRAVRDNAPSRAAGAAAGAPR
jgi:hypothetical protein